MSQVDVAQSPFRRRRWKQSHNPSGRNVPQCQRGESAEAYERRIGGNFEALRSKLSGLETNQNLMTYDNVRIAVVQGNQGDAVGLAAAT